jgi:hypothetical protein
MLKQVQHDGFQKFHLSASPSAIIFRFPTAHKLCQHPPMPALNRRRCLSEVEPFLQTPVFKASRPSTSSTSKPLSVGAGAMRLLRRRDCP